MKELLIFTKNILMIKIELDYFFDYKDIEALNNEQFSFDL